MAPGELMSDSALARALGPQPPAYSLLVLEHFTHPRNAGLLPGPGVTHTRSGNHAAGAEVALSIRWLEERVAEVRFQAYGCPHFLAAASLVTERLSGLTARQVARWSARDLWEELAVPVEKRGRLLILEDAVRAAAQYSAT